VNSAASWERAQRVEALVLDVDGVLTDGRVYFGAEGEAFRAFSVRDGMGLAILRRLGYRVAILSGRESSTVRHRARELGIDPVLLGETDKAAGLRRILDHWSLTADKVAAMGDDFLDWPMLSRVGLSLAPEDAHEEIRSRVDHVVPAVGGRGAVREACEFLVRASGRWDEVLTHFTLSEKEGGA
jgi:3-deoxy-D-manno-octulosonate 8-phosphate phosphatase (KDO 8-P phosphatase)